MEEKELKTSLGQRIAISVIAILMVGSMIAGWAAIILNGGGSTSSSSANYEITEEKKAEYEEKYAEKLVEFQNGTSDLYETFAKYYNAETYDEDAANNSGVVSKDLYVGNGKMLLEGDTDYLAFYAGWCANGTVFDSSLDNTSNPTTFTKALDASAGMISGWNTGVVGMQLGGVREITIPGEQAYGEQMEICGGYNKPLKFLVMVVPNEDPLKTLAYMVDQAYLRVQYANYGIDYDAMVNR